MGGGHIVKYVSGWKYDNNNALSSFTPRSTDILVAAVNFTSDTITDLQGQTGAVYGIAKGYAGGNLTFKADWWNGVANAGEFGVTGSFVTPHPAGNVLTYLHGDHLGSASLATNASGDKVSELRYFPYGETRSGSLPTDRRFTGQRYEAGLGVYDYNARYYDPTLGRFLAADSMVTSPGNPQSLNRYSYVLNNPLKYVDPSGHFDVPAGECGELCQLMGFGDYDTFNTWWSGLADDWKTLLQAARWGDMLSFTYNENTLNLVFVQMSSGTPRFHAQGILDNAKLALWDNDMGASIDLLTGLELWAEGSNHGYMRLGDSGHPWNGSDLIEGRGEYVSFDQTWQYGHKLVVRGEASASLITLGMITGGANVPTWVGKLLNWLGWGADVFAGVDMADVAKELTVDSESWSQLGPPMVYDGGIVEHLKRNPWTWQSPDRYSLVGLR